MRTVRLSERELVNYLLLQDGHSSDDWEPKRIVDDTWIKNESGKHSFNCDFQLEFQGRYGLKLREHTSRTISVAAIPEFLGADVFLTYFPELKTLYSLGLFGGYSTWRQFPSEDHDYLEAKINQSLSAITTFTFLQRKFSFVRMVRLPHRFVFSFLADGALVACDEWMKTDNSLFVRNGDVAIDCTWEHGQLVYVDGSVAAPTIAVE